MCGFGDKVCDLLLRRLPCLAGALTWRRIDDPSPRRPVSASSSATLKDARSSSSKLRPPSRPRVEVATDASLVLFSEADSQHFILNVDLWDADATHEVNLVRHSNTSPSVSISMATTTSFPPPPEPAQPQMIMMPGGPGQDPTFRPVHGHGDYYGGPAGYPYGPGPGGVMPPNVVSNTAGMFTRNLIGSVTVSASTLNDLNDRAGFWFVLQDLSVRTEGSFRFVLFSPLCSET